MRYLSKKRRVMLITHFVKLIINGEKRELNGMGSGANPRTAIGQREDGSVLFFSN